MIWPFRKRRRLVCREIDGTGGECVVSDSETGDRLYYGSATMWWNIATGKRVALDGSLHRFWMRDVIHPRVQAEIAEVIGGSKP